ncbi:hypothetical protein V8C86DRAFT_2852809 [Haematococcus lacustris]
MLPAGQEWLQMARAVHDTSLKAASVLAVAVAHLTGVFRRDRTGPARQIPQHARDAAISSVCTGLAGPHLGKGLATAARRVATELGQASASVQDRCDEALDSIHHAQFAVPNITACYKCEQLLQQAPAPRTGKPAWFYPGYGQAGVLGTEYRSTCATCTLVYDIEGYQLVSTAGTRLGVKLPLEPAHRHPDWVKVSSQTFIHTSFVEVYEAQLHTSHASFEKMTEAHNYMVESHLKQSGRAREERTLLYEKRLAAAVFRGQLLTTVDLLPLELRGNYNLKAQLNHLLDQAYPHRFEKALDEAHEHLRAYGLGAVVIDGNSSSKRDRCSCLDPEMLAGGPDRLGLRDRDGVFFYKYCLCTPARGDPEGRCWQCRDLDRHPPGGGRRGATDQGAGEEEDEAEETNFQPSQAVELNSLSRHLPTEAGLPPPRRGSRARTPSVRLRSLEDIPMAAAAIVIPLLGRKRRYEVLLQKTLAAAGTIGSAPQAAALGSATMTEQPSAGTTVLVAEGLRLAQGLDAAGSAVYTAERLCGERVVRGSLYYKVTWKGWRESTWEPSCNILDTRLLEEWRARCERRLPGTRDTEENLEEEPVLPEKAGQEEELEAALLRATEDVEEDQRSKVQASMRNAAKAGGGTRQGRGFKYSMCGLRVGGKDGRLTAGCCWAMCPDGYLFPGFEMPDCESTRMTMLNILKWFEGREYYGREGHKFVFVYDDMCHLLRWALKRAHLHPEILRFTQASHAVDVFHFVHNHKGVWCDKMVNPFNVPALKGVNTEVCEQRFRHINKYAGMLRRMSQERFNWTLLTIVDMDHKFRAMRLTRSSV